MLYIGYFIIVNRNIKKKLQIFHFCPIEGGQLLEQFVHKPNATEPPTNNNFEAFGGPMARAT